MQAAHTATLAGAGMVDLADMKRRAKGRQATFAEQPGKLPALVGVMLVLHVEQPLEGQGLDEELAHCAPR